MWIIAVVVAALLIGFFVFLRVAGHGRFPWIQFYTKGKESGFTFREIGLLRKVAIETKIDNPTSLFWSIKQLDRSIKEIIIKIRGRDMLDDADSNDLLGKLYELRKRVEFDLPRYRLGLRSTREIMARQRVRVTIPGAGPFQAIVLENPQRYLAMSRPQGPGLPPGFKWSGQQIGVHFWRAEDAGYFFKSKVLNDFVDQNYEIIHVAHTDDIARTQKRRSIRVKMNHPAQVYPLRSIQDANEQEERERGLRCRLKDLSEDGAALMVGGRTKAGVPIKLQFELADYLVVMCGLVKGVNYDQQKNVSLLHVQAVPLSARTRNHILTYVYNVFGEQERERA
ncbi:MAG: PilZ domain-containing protein [Spirochaetales bacterium]|nr:PilZ domain-containing protein [Spirochaetales bacterium]